MSKEHKLQLTDEERDLLAGTLDSVLSEFGYEIAGTDSHDWREQLELKRDTISKVLETLREA